MIGITSTNSRILKFDFGEFVNFSGANYLDLAANPAVISAALEACKLYGLSSDLGYDVATQPIKTLEEVAESFFNVESTVFSPSTYLAVCALVLTLAGDEADIFVDENAHHSSFHAARLSGGNIHTYRHCNTDDLDNKLSALTQRSHRTILILTDGVFPTFGTVAPLPALLATAEKYNANIIVDDAHGTGVLGKNGRGTIEHYSIRSPHLFFAAGMGKAIGVQGAIIPTDIGTAYKIKSQNAVYGSVSLPVSGVAAAITTSLSLAQNSVLRDKLFRNKLFFADGLRQLNFDLHIHGPAPIVSFSLGSAEANYHARDKIREAGYWVNVSRYTGSPPEGVLRHAIMVSHTEEDINSILEVYSSLFKGVVSYA